MNISIDTEFKNLIPPLTAEEYAGLEESILREGCRDAIVLWGETIIDGHNRYEICTKHGVDFRTVQKVLDDRNAAKLWMMQNQLARRNLTDFQRIEIAHKCEDAVRAKAKESQVRKSADFVMEKLPEQKPIVSRDELGTLAGVSGKTYEHAVTVLETAPAPVVEATRRNDISINAAYQVTKMEPEQQEEISARIEQGETPKAVIADVQKRPHVAFNSGNNEWYTPIEYIEAARKAMGSIDLDPASSEIANKVVKAGTFYTAETNGLDKRWGGNIWMNPPYSSDLIGKFVDKLVEERENYNQAIVLVNNATETEWFNKIVSIASAVCFPKGRVKFYMPDGKTGAPLQGQAIIYIGDNIKAFMDAFSLFGWRVMLYEL